MALTNRTASHWFEPTLSPIPERTSDDEDDKRARKGAPELVSPRAKDERELSPHKMLRAAGLECKPHPKYTTACVVDRRAGRVVFHGTEAEAEACAERLNKSE